LSGTGLPPERSRNSPQSVVKGWIFLDFSGFLFFVSFPGTSVAGAASVLQGHVARSGLLRCVTVAVAWIYSAKFVFLPRFHLPNEPAMSPSSPNSQLQQLLELLSAQHDGQLSAAEQQQLQQLAAQYPQQARQFQDACHGLSRDLRRLPQRSLPGPIFSAAAEDQVPWLVRHADRRGRRWARLAALVSTLTVLGLLVMFTRNPPSQPDRGVVARQTPAFQTDSAAESVQLQRAVSPQEVPAAAAPVVAAAPPAGAVAMSEARMSDPQATAAESLSGFAAPAQVSPQQVQLLADTADWKVVLVKVGTVDRSDVKVRVSKVLQQHGLLLADTAPVQMPEWLGVVLSADALLQQSLIQAVSVAVDGQASEWNPGQILSASREEIIAAVRRSLASPTQAELARGEIYVAVRDDVSAFSKAGADQAARAPANRLDFYNGLNGAQGTAAAGQGQAAAAATSAADAPAAARSPTASSAQVTLFVFQFAAAAEESGDPDQPLPGKVRNIF
jgi:hypothetical protein